MTDRPLVIKFGGTSVGEGAAFLRAARIAAGAAQDRPLAVVVSAMNGATDALLGFAEALADPSTRASARATREGSLVELYRALADQHLAAACEAVPVELLPEVEDRLRTILERLVRTVSAPSDDLAARKDAIASCGERLSAEILAGAINGLGTPAAVAPDDPIATNDDFGGAKVLAEARRRTRGYVWPLLDAGLVAVVSGYVGRAPNGAVTTLGRGGSDLSATVLGRALCSGEVWIMTDVEGVLEADPCLIPDAGSIRHLSYREAAQFAILGAKVLHPDTAAPAAAGGIEVRVRSTFDPDSSGTRISGREGEPGIRGVALSRGLSLTHVRSETAGNAFCVLGADADGLKVLVDGTPADVAAIVCIGAPTDTDLLTGLRCLHRTGIRPLFAGNTSAGLLFIVSGDVAELGLRALHAGLVSAIPTNMKEVA
jgi:aspartate kinase